MRTFISLLLFVTSSVWMEQRTVFALNNRPVIGIAVQRAPPSFKLFKYGDGFIHSPYVRFLESGGARVVPVMLYETERYYKSLFMKINGLLLPGGGCNLTNSGYAVIGRYFMRFAMEANDVGDYFPIWGTCRGMQLMMRAVSGQKLLQFVDARNYPVPLDFEPGFRESKLFRNAPERIIRLLQNESVAIANHKNGILYQNFTNNEALTNIFQIISTNIDRQNQKFISTIEARRYPFYGVQYHPEKAAFLWDEKFKFPHTREAIDVGYYFASFFVDEARRSNHRFSSQKEEQEAVIQNHPGYHDTQYYPFEIIYAFNCTKRVIEIDQDLR